MEEEKHSHCSCWKCKARRGLKNMKIDHGDDFMAWRRALQGGSSGMTQDRGADSLAQAPSSKNNTPSVQTKPTLSIQREPRLEDSPSFDDSFDSTSSPIPGTVKPSFTNRSIFQSISPIKLSSEHKESASPTTTGEGFGYLDSAMNTGFGSQNGWFGNDAIANNPWTGSGGSEHQQNRFW